MNATRSVALYPTERGKVSVISIREYGRPHVYEPSFAHVGRILLCCQWLVAKGLFRLCMSECVIGGMIFIRE